MNNPSVRYVYVYAPEVLVDGIWSSIEQHNAENPLDWIEYKTAQNFIPWALKRALDEVAGLAADGFMACEAMESIYRKFRFDFESYVFRLMLDIGTSSFREDLNYSMVLKDNRLFLTIY